METLIRLSTAHARARLSKSIDAIDAKSAVEMVQFSHYQKVLEKPGRKKKAGTGEGSDGESEEEEEEMEVEEAIPSGTSSRRGDAKRSRDVYEFEGESADSQPTPAAPKKAEAPKPKLIALSDERLKAFRQFLFKIFRKEMSQSLLKSKVFDSVRQEAESEGVLKFTDDEVESALHKMQDNNMIFLSGDLVILV